MSMSPIEQPDYSDGMTKQSFKDETDINKILAKVARGGSIAHLAKHGAVYGDFTDIDDLMTAHERLKRGEQIFNELPGEVKREFANSPQKFFNFVNDPANVDRLGDLIPGLAKQGNQMPQVTRNLMNQSEASSSGMQEELGTAQGVPNQEATPDQGVAN